MDIGLIVALVYYSRCFKAVIFIGNYDYDDWCYDFLVSILILVGEFKGDLQLVALIIRCSKNPIKDI